MAVICNNILATIPVNHAVSTGISAFACCCGIILLVWHYENKTIHLPTFAIVIFFIFAIVGGISFILFLLLLIKAAVPEQEVAPPAQELRPLPRAPES